MNKNNLIDIINQNTLNIKKISKHYPFLYFIKFFEKIDIAEIENIINYLLKIINIDNNKLLLTYTDDNTIYNELINFTQNIVTSEDININNNIHFFACFLNYLTHKTQNNKIISCTPNQTIFKITKEDISYFLQNILCSQNKQHFSFTLLPIFNEFDIKQIIIELIQNYNGAIDDVTPMYVRNHKYLYDNVYRVYVHYPLSFYITKNKAIKISNCIDIAIVNNQINIFFSVNNLLENKKIKQITQRQINLSTRQTTFLNWIDCFNDNNITKLTYQEFQQIIDLISFETNIKINIHLILYFLFILQTNA